MWAGAVDVRRRRDVEGGGPTKGEMVWSEMVFSNNGQYYGRSLVVVPDLHDSEREHIPVPGDVEDKPRPRQHGTRERDRRQ
jgi:hypothetical protein